MYKKRRITTLKHRATRIKQHARRALARRLIRGDITIDQLDRLAGPASSGVLRTVNYIRETEGSTISPTLAQAVAAAVAPGIERCESRPAQDSRSSAPPRRGQACERRVPTRRLLPKRVSRKPQSRKS